MNENCLSALIVAKPGRMRDSLWILLRAMPQLKQVEQVDDASSALKLVKKHHPALLILLTSGISNEEVRTLLGQAKLQSGPTQSLVLVNTIRQQEVAQTAGADQVLLSGLPATRFFEVVEGLLVQPARELVGRSA